MYILQNGFTTLFYGAAVDECYTSDLQQIYVQNIRSISDLYTRKALLQDPLGVLIKSCNTKSRYEFKVVDLKYYSEISEDYFKLEQIRSINNMDQQANPWITKVKGKAQHERSLIKNRVKTPCKTSTENNAVPQGKLRCSLNERVGLMPRYKSEAPQLMHSSKRLKDTLTEKRHQYNLDLSKSSVPTCCSLQKKPNPHWICIRVGSRAWPIA